MADSLVDSRDGRCAHLGGCTARVSVGSLIVHDPRGHSPTAVRSTCAGGKSSLPHLSTVMRRFPRMLRGCGHGGLERPTTFPAHTWRRLCAPRAAALPDARAPAPPIDAAATALQAQPPAAIVTAAAAASGGLPGGPYRRGHLPSARRLSRQPRGRAAASQPDAVIARPPLHTSALAATTSLPALAPHPRQVTVNGGYQQERGAAAVEEVTTVAAAACVSGTALWEEVESSAAVGMRFHVPRYRRHSR